MSSLLKWFGFSSFSATTDANHASNASDEHREELAHVVRVDAANNASGNAMSGTLPVVTHSQEGDGEKSGNEQSGSVVSSAPKTDAIAVECEKTEENDAKESSPLVASVFSCAMEKRRVAADAKNDLTVAQKRVSDLRSALALKYEDLSDVKQLQISHEKQLEKLRQGIVTFEALLNDATAQRQTLEAEIVVAEGALLVAFDDFEEKKIRESVAAQEKTMSEEVARQKLDADKRLLQEKEARLQEN